MTTNRSNADDFDPGPLAEVQSTLDDGRWTLVFTRDFRHTPDRVWTALTDPTELASWAPFTTSRDLATIGDAVLTMIDGDTSEDLPAAVTRVEPPNLLEYTWGDDRLRWELRPTAAGTRLTLHHTVHLGPDWLPKVAAGWHLCLLVADRLLAGSPIPPIRGQDALNYGWSTLADAYAAALDLLEALRPSSSDEGHATA